MGRKNEHRNADFAGIIDRLGGSSGVAVEGGEEEVGVIHEVTVADGHTGCGIGMAGTSNDVGGGENVIIAALISRGPFIRLAVKWDDHFKGNMGIAGAELQHSLRGEHIHAQGAAGKKMRMLRARKGSGDEYLFPDRKGRPLSLASFQRVWCQLMLASGCARWREVDEYTNRPNDIRKQVKPTLTLHYFRHNYVTMLYESGIDPLLAMKIVGHADYQTTANIYTHLSNETLRRAHVNLDRVFSEGTEE